MAVNFYKASINVNFKRNVNLDEKWASIEKCAWEFSLRRRFKKLITLIDIKDNSLDFVMVSNSKIELEKFKDFVAMSMKNYSPDPSLVIMQDGGELCDHSLSAFSAEVWNDFEKEFLKLY